MLSISVTKYLHYMVVNVYFFLFVFLCVFIIQGELSIMVFPECVWTTEHVLVNSGSRQR